MGADRGAASESGRPAAERAPNGCLRWVRRAGRWRRERRWLPHGRAPEQAFDAHPHTPPGIPPAVLPRRTLRAGGPGGGLRGGCGGCAAQAGVVRWPGSSDAADRAGRLRCHPPVLCQSRGVRRPPPPLGCGWQPRGRDAAIVGVGRELGQHSKTERAAVLEDVLRLLLGADSDPPAGGKDKVVVAIPTRIIFSLA